MTPAAEPLEVAPDSTPADTTEPAAPAAETTETTDATAPVEDVESAPVDEDVAITPQADVVVTQTGTPVLSASVSVADGLAPFNDSDAPGYDSSDSNGIIRSGDFAFYRVALSANEADVTEPITIEIDLPQGTRLESPTWLANPSGVPQLPAFCGPGSTISGTVSSPIPAIADQRDLTIEGNSP